MIDHTDCNCPVCVAHRQANEALWHAQCRTDRHPFAPLVNDLYRLWSMGIVSDGATIESADRLIAIIDLGY